MADLMTGSSGYQTGATDTATTQTNNVSPHNANHINGVAQGVIQVETILGTGTSLKGNKADLVARLAVVMDADGKIDIGTDANLNNNLSVAKGGTGVTTLTATKVLLGDGTNDVAFGSGLAYQGPTSTGAGSTATHEGTVTIAGNQALSGVHYYTNFTLNSGVTITPAAGSNQLVIVATDTITISGTIAANGAGSTGGIGGAAGLTGFSQAGGGGGGHQTSGAGGAGGSIFMHSVLLKAGGAGAGPSGTGGTPTTQTGTSAAFSSYYSLFGGAGGGGGGGAGGNPGGNGGASVVLIAPTIVLAATATINTSGANGVVGGGNAGGSGGGGAGNIFMLCRSYTDSGATFTQTGGAAGPGTGGGGNGGAGAAGVKQILIYA